MSLTEKIDVLDMIIDVLVEHEKKQDELVEKMGVIVNKLSYLSSTHT